MDAKTLETICEQVYHKFPEVKGIRPKLQPLSKGKNFTAYPCFRQSCDHSQRNLDEPGSEGSCE